MVDSCKSHFERSHFEVEKALQSFLLNSHKTCNQHLYNLAKQNNWHNKQTDISKSRNYISLYMQTMLPFEKFLNKM